MDQIMRPKQVSWKILSDYSKGTHEIYCDNPMIFGGTGTDVGIEGALAGNESGHHMGTLA